MFRSHTVPKAYHVCKLSDLSNNAENIFEFETRNGVSASVPMEDFEWLIQYYRLFGIKEIREAVQQKHEDMRQAAILRNRKG